MVRLNFRLNKFKGSLVLKTSKAVILFLNKVPGTRTSVGEISRSFDPHLLDISHTTCTTPNEPVRKRLGRTLALVGGTLGLVNQVLVPFVPHRDSLCTLPVTLPNL